MKQQLTYLRDAVLHSYSQVFFSQDKVLAVCILLVTWLHPRIGGMGLGAVLLVNLMAYLMGFSRLHIREGLLGFNALLLGLWLGFQHQAGRDVVLLGIVGCMLLLLLTMVVKGVMEKRGLPFLSLPFLLTYWLLQPVGHYLLGIHADLPHAPLAGEPVPLWHTLSHCMDAVPLPQVVSAYFRNLSGIFFIDSIAGGALLAAGLLWFSRIGFSLTVIGFGVAWAGYQALGLDMAPLLVHLSGANPILFALSLGGFFLVPQARTYLLVAMLAPVLMAVTFTLSHALDPMHLKAFTLAFSLLTIGTLLALQQRTQPRHLLPVIIQYYHPEKTLYKHLSSLHRFKHAHLAKVTLPFFGEWKVSQGHDGKITHLGDWSKALDFVIVDERGKTYADPGAEVDDFHCQGKPVLAPLDGWVQEIISHVEDNPVGGVNTEQNWGNTIVLRHTDNLFSQLSHLRKDSLKVAVGDYVTRGTVLAACGNSGRSPEPHLHFQMQASPKVGAKTLSYPLAYFIEHKGSQEVLHVGEVPQEGMTISNVQVNALLRDSLALAPGRKLRWMQEDADAAQEWEVFTDAWNRSYVYCHSTQAYAYFENDGIMFRFTDFEGSKDSLLFHFYLSQYRILLGCHPTIVLHDTVPLIHRSVGWLRWAQDLVAPFLLFTAAQYQSQVVETDDAQNPTRITMRSGVTTALLGRPMASLSYETSFSEGRLSRLTLHHTGKPTHWTCAG